MQRLDDAARTWTAHPRTAHPRTAQTQMRDATEQLLQGFGGILQQLDTVIEPAGSGSGSGSGSVNCSGHDRRAVVFKQCETQLRGLLQNFHGFVQSRELVMDSVRTLSGASSGLRDMAEGVATVIVDGPPIDRHKPSVDVLFRSVAEITGRDALGIMLTGMGDDGARGMKQMHDGGARTIAQDEASCVVFGMPKEAIKLGAVDDVMPLDRVARAIMQFDARG